MKLQDHISVHCVQEYIIWRDNMSGYHKLNINKHFFNSPYKLVEEAEEFIDSITQKNKIMAALELSDLYGSLEYQAERLGFTIQELKTMSDATKAAFKRERPSFDLLDYLKKNHTDIKNFGLGFIQVKVNNINYNFYHNDFYKFDDYDLPHSHQYNFVSEIIAGSLTEKRYDVYYDSCGYKLVCNCGNPDAISPNKSYELIETNVYRTGDLYYCDNDVYHTVEFENNTITKVVKDLSNKKDAFNFTKDIVNHLDLPEYPPELLWKDVEKIYRNNFK